jgi:hypothetical protein
MPIDTPGTAIPNEIEVLSRACAAPAKAVTAIARATLTPAAKRRRIDLIKRVMKVSLGS